MVVTTMLPLVLAGCTSKDGAQSAADKSQYVSTTPKPSGDINSVNWGVAGSEPTSLDWIYDWDYGPSNLIEANLCEGLMRQNPDGSTTPGLATKVSSPNDTTYVYTIRDGVTFTDGSPLTADDVAFSLNRNLKASPPSYWGLWYQNVASIAATGRHEVTARLKSPDALFASVMTTPAGYVGEKKYIEQKGSSYGTAAGGVMCTGPYALESWDKGQSITLKANAHYWDKALEPRAKTFTFSFIPDPSALNSALLTGEVDGAWSMNVSSLKPLVNAKAGNLYLNKGTEVVGMQFNDLTTGPLSNPKIREALRALVDYQGITRGLLGGYAAPTKTAAPEPTWGYSKAIWAAGYKASGGASQDLTKARQLVKEAGAPTQPIVIAVSTDDQSVVSVATSIQASAKSVGLDIQVKSFPASEYTNLFYDPTARAGLNAFMSTVTVDTPDPLEIYYQAIPGSPYNYTGIKNSEWTNYLQEAIASTDDAKRATATVKAEEVVDKNVYSISLYSLDARVFLGKRITGVPVSSLSQWYYPWAATVGAR
ncbi:hypothetical protein LK09_07920 [Microbacterium mangrovi]|uniref:Solute-binding protein family 5 domain-containing protein n=1 Tax=Microbacterium mangrovi TaxID=1348253 RepID=A0A0B2A6V7_9MICO|nr:ABC transporter substrate-binding protein [Microbacterium mangrovi]KHK98805.1 hypothetical protein LK09_07920 [Microbacterium mangrovi]